MNVDLLYGKGQIQVELPSSDDVHVVRKPRMPVQQDPKVAVTRSFEESVESESLHKLAEQSSSACIAICDITRPVPNHLFLRPMIETLVSAGIGIEDICILVATGLHRPNEGEELRELINDEWVLENVRVINHNARDDEQHVHLGTTRTRNTVVKLDRRFVEAHLKIATGLVEPHFMAGYSGGRKVIAPGLAHAETITTFHSARFMGDPNARNCNFVGNPLHEEQLEILQLLGPCYALNTVIDEARNLSYVNFGEIVASHREAVAFVRSYCEIPVDQKFSTVITSAAGYPLDKTYYQTIKGMVGAIGILEPDGDLIIVSECSEGFGSPEFREAQMRLIAQGDDGFLNNLLKKSHADIDEWQSQMLLKPKEIGRIHLYSPELSDDDQALTGVNQIRDLQETVQACISSHANPTVAVIPEGPYVIPYVPESNTV